MVEGNSVQERMGVIHFAALELEGRSEEPDKVVVFLDLPMGGGCREGGEPTSGREARARACDHISTARQTP